MPITFDITMITIMVGILSIGLLIYCILLHNRLRSLTKKYEYFMNGEDGSSLERIPIPWPLSLIPIFPKSNFSLTR